MSLPYSNRWVFGYGSLIWRPGFEYLRSEPARLSGYHRQLCVLSHKYRGTQEKLGLVFGLAEAGFCHGMAFEVAGERWPETITYLRDREQVTSVYIEKQVTVELASSRVSIEALTYVADKRHRQYVGGLTQEQTLVYVRQGLGEAGSCADYVRNTAQHLRDMGFPDAEVDALAAAI